MITSSATRNVWIYLSFCAGLIVTIAFSYLFFDYESIGANPEQSDFPIDGHYYFHLATLLISENNNSLASFFEGLYRASPNASSLGVVAYATALTYAFGSLTAISYFLFAATFISFLLLIRSGKLPAYSFLLFSTGISPYLLTPSKESLFLFSFLLILSRSLKLSWQFYVGVAGMLLARPEAALIFLLTWAFAHLYRKRGIYRLSAIVAALVAYVALREVLFEISTLFQAKHREGGQAFCELFIFDFCISHRGELEAIYIQRLIASALAPINWIMDIWQVIFDSSGLERNSIFIRLLNALSVLPFIFCLVRLIRTTRVTSDPAFLFAVTYFAVYSCILFFQSSRQLVFITSLLSIYIFYADRRSTRMY